MSIVSRGLTAAPAWRIVSTFILLTIMVTTAMQGQSGPPIRTVDRGTQSGIGDARVVTIRSATEWEALWVQHAAGRERPAVDWERDMVIGRFMGRRSTGGFGVEIVDVEARSGTLVVRYRETQPAPGGITAQVLTSPYHLAVVPAWAGTVAFEAVP